MNIEIEGIPLIRRVEDEQTRALVEIRSVHNVSISGNRAIVEHRIPGSSSNVLQDMGRWPVKIWFEGDFYGERAKDSLQELWAKFKDGEPVSFSSDLSMIADVTKVLIEEFTLQTAVGAPNRYRYRMVLREYVPPREAETPPPSQEEEAEKDVEKESELHDIKGQVLDTDGNPLKDATVVVRGPSGEYRVKTDAEGYYVVHDVAEGKYEITVEAPGFEESKAEVEVKKGEATASQ